MKIEKISKTDDKVSFIISGINTTIANAIRRSVAEIPCLAIDTVEVYKNDSALYDEMIAHRLGLIPLRATSPFIEPGKCTCKGKGCNKCTAALKLKEKGPKTVYASDLKARGLEVVYPEMPIVLLAPDQEIELVAEARLGKGVEHAKFSPGLVWFNVLPKIKELKVLEKGKKTMKLPAKEFEALKRGESALTPDLINDIVESEGKYLKVEPSETDFIFFIESFGHLKPTVIFTEAIKALNANLSEFEKAAKKIK